LICSTKKIKPKFLKELEKIQNSKKFKNSRLQVSKFCPNLISKIVHLFNKSEAKFLNFGGNFEKKIPRRGEILAAKGPVGGWRGKAKFFSIVSEKIRLFNFEILFVALA
jgi:hypothetical protein